MPVLEYLYCHFFLKAALENELSDLKKSHTETKEACYSYQKDASKWKDDLDHEKSERKQVGCIVTIYFNNQVKTLKLYSICMSVLLISY